MRIKTVILSFVIALSGISSTLMVAAQDEDVRGSFLTSRPKTTGSASGSAKTGPTSKPSHRRPKPTAPNPNGPKDGGATLPPNTNVVNTARMGLGLTLFMRDSNGLAVRTDPGREFHKGDHVRFLIETSADGYLYVFNSTDSGQPVMLYPDPELDEAGNYFQAHVPFEIPSPAATEERLRWLTFDAQPGAEHIFFVFTREPLNGVPIEDDLITLCREKESACPWRPSTEAWAAIQGELNEPVKVAKVKGVGRVKTEAEQRATTRGIGLNRTDPEPSLIMLSSSTTKNILVVSLDLIHVSPSAADSGEEQ
ncbi:MAG TPA: DUF4384 domain-containing protein [Pyrinomonadaceae bacterium]|nr:DUF4384 domain-containing protein [Pyrinomonadaceae bacterium]